MQGDGYQNCPTAPKMLNPFSGKACAWGNPIPQHLTHRGKNYPKRIYFHHYIDVD